MPSLWNDGDAAACTDALALRAYTSRLLGADPDLVLLGGGNTSLKATSSGAAAGTLDALFVKGTGSDLSRVGPADFTPLALEPTRRLLEYEHLDTAGMMQALAPLTLRPDAPKPSIETLLHASVPYRHVEHTHADHVLALANTASGRRIVAEVFGARAPLVPFHHSGFELAKACAETFNRERTPRTIGLVLAFHGVVAFADDARESYENMIALADGAQAYLRDRGAWDLPSGPPPRRSAASARALAQLRSRCSRAAGFPMIASVDASGEAVGYAGRSDLEVLALQGPPTPQHAVFTKRLPLLGQDVARYVADHGRYLEAHAPVDAPARSLPDPAPRIVVDPAFGCVAFSVDAPHAAMTGEVYRHDIRICSRAQAHDRYVSLPPEAILLAEIHYGGFDRALRAEAPTRRPRLGTVVLAVDRSADQIATLLQEGAAVLHTNRADAFADHPAARLIGGALAEDDLVDAVHAFGGIDAVIGDRVRVGAAGLLQDILSLSPVLPS